MGKSSVSTLCQKAEILGANDFVFSREGIDFKRPIKEFSAFSLLARFGNYTLALFLSDITSDGKVCFTGKWAEGAIASSVLDGSLTFVTWNKITGLIIGQDFSPPPMGCRAVAGNA